MLSTPTTSGLDQRIAVAALVLLADIRVRLARVADALADGEEALAVTIVEDLEHDLAKRFIV